MFQKHYVFYIAASSLTFAGITCVIMRGRHADMQSVPDGLAKVTVHPFSFLSNQKNNIVTVIERDGRGHPGYRIRCIETGTEYSSQGEAARDLNVSPSIISSQINKQFDNANGYHFERIHSDE